MSGPSGVSTVAQLPWLWWELAQTMDQVISLRAEVAELQAGAARQMLASAAAAPVHPLVAGTRSQVLFLDSPGSPSAGRHRGADYAFQTTI
jgi:hypothetical protein